MKLKRCLTILLILALSVMMFTACGSDTDNKDSKGSGGGLTATPTVEPTPTEAPKTPEQQDLEMLTQILESAKETYQTTEYTIDAGSTFIVRFEDNNIVMSMFMRDDSFQRKIMEEWIYNSDSRSGTYQMQSEKFPASCRYGELIGTVNNEGNIHWTANNLDAGLLSQLKSLGVEPHPDYVARLELYEEIQGTWYGEIQLSMQAVLTSFIDKNDKESMQFYRNLFSLLKEYGYNDNMLVTATCVILNEKELNFKLTTDWSNFLDSIHKATTTKDSMTRFLCTVGGIDKSTLNAVLSYQGLDVMTYGASIVREFEKLCDSYHGEDMTGRYTCSGDIITFTDGKVKDQFTYNRSNNTMYYKDFGIECTLKKQ